MDLPPVVHHPAYTADMPSNHRFPMGKYRRLAEVLVEEGLVPETGFSRPELAGFEALAAVHDRTYVRQVFDLAVPRDVERRIGLPISRAVADRAQTATGGTLLAARLALEHGLACNTAGGSHHAGPDGGAGFCTFNDVAVAAQVMLDEGAVGQVLVVDCDVHQGDGTARIFAQEPRVFTFSMQGEKNYPVRRAKSDLDIELPDGTTDAPYLTALQTALPGVMAQVQPDLVFYIAGVDPHADDRLGRLSLSDQGLAARDAYVLAACLPHAPVVGVIGGGYDKDVDRLAKRHATLHRAAAIAWQAGLAATPRSRPTPDLTARISGI